MGCNQCPPRACRLSPGFAERLSGFGDTVIDSCQKTSEGFDKACGKSYLSYTYIIFLFSFILLFASMEDSR